MLLRIVSIDFRVFIIVLVGNVSGHKHESEMIAANCMNMEVFLSALIFSALAGKIPLMDMAVAWVYGPVGGWRRWSRTSSSRSEPCRRRLSISSSPDASSRSPTKLHPSS